MSIENATVTGWRPVTRQDLIDLANGGEPQKARFRDLVPQMWRERYLFGFESDGSNIRYLEGDASWRGRTVRWQICEIKTQVLRDPKFSDLDNGPIECMIYPDWGNQQPWKGILVGMKHNPNNKRNTTGMEYATKRPYERNSPNASVSFEWHVKVVDKSPKPEQEKEHEVSVKLNSMIDANGVVGVAIAEPAPQAPEPEQTSTGWRTPTVEDLKDGPIACEVRDYHDEPWIPGFLVCVHNSRAWRFEAQRQTRFYVDPPHWNQCRIRVTEPAPQAPEPEQTSTGWRTPTVEDLKNGPIWCEVRDCEKEGWTTATLRSIDFGSGFPYSCNNFAWTYCRIKVTEPAPQARFREVDTGDEGKQVEFLDERTGEFVERTLLRFATRGGCVLPVDQDGCVCVYARIRR
jgi:hypothetical protein